MGSDRSILKKMSRGSSMSIMKIISQPNRWLLINNRKIISVIMKLRKT